MERIQRIRGALLGLAVGDALGTTLEFQPRDWRGRLTRHEQIRAVAEGLLERADVVGGSHARASRGRNPAFEQDLRSRSATPPRQAPCT